MACSSSCRTKDHPTFGACLRAKNLQVADVEAHRRNSSMHKGLDAYRSAREAGLQPDGVFPAQVAKAWETTDQTGVPYRGDHS